MAQPDHIEIARLETLRELDILDSPPTWFYDSLTTLASFVCEAPIAALTFVDEHRAWLKAKVGISAFEIPRRMSYCQHTIESRDVVLIPDATSDPRLIGNPLAAPPHNLRFYVGVPLLMYGHAVGALCVLDRRPRELTASQISALSILASLAVEHLKLESRVHQADPVSQAA